MKTEKEESASAPEEKEPQTTEQQTGEQAEAPAATDGLHTYYKERYPDKQFASDIDFLEDAGTELSSAHKKLADYDTANQTLTEVFNDYPEFAEVIDDLKKGVDLRVALAKRFDPDDFQVDEAEEAAKDYEEARANRKKSQQEAKDRIAQREKNWQETQDVFKSTREKIGWDEEKENKFGQWLSSSLNDISMGKITPELMNKLRQGYMFEEAVEQARTDGEIDGKNANIEAKRVKQAESGDSMPTGSAGATEIPEELPTNDVPLGDVEALIDRKRKRW